MFRSIVATVFLRFRGAFPLKALPEGVGLLSDALDIRKVTAEEFLRCDIIIWTWNRFFCRTTSTIREA